MRAEDLEVDDQGKTFEEMKWQLGLKNFVDNRRWESVLNDETNSLAMGLRSRAAASRQRAGDGTTLNYSVCFSRYFHLAPFLDATFSSLLSCAAMKDLLKMEAMIRQMLNE
jgi:hypothetical protein